MRIPAYCVMPNHWHLVLHPKKDGDLSKFVRWLTLTHTQRHHAKTRTIGTGHLYQGRYKSFPVQTDSYFIQLAKYVECNPLRARLVAKAEDWRWGSAWRRTKGSIDDKKLLSEWPVPAPVDYESLLNQTDKNLDRIRLSVNRGQPLGDDLWSQQTTERFNLGSTIRPQDRPRKST